MQSKQATGASARQDDKQAIRASVDRWLEATKKGDAATLLSLLADDVMFITSGREPFGKEEFANAEEMKMDADIDIKELEVAGDWAWMRSFLNITFTPDTGEPNKMSGHILNIWQKQPDGTWVIKRDANFVKPETN